MSSKQLTLFRIRKLLKQSSSFVKLFTNITCKSAEYFPCPRIEFDTPASLAANLLAAQAEETHGEVINIACGEQITINAVIEHINRCVGKSVKPLYVPDRPGDVKHSMADISLAEKVIGYKPVVQFAEGLEKAIKWYRQNLL